MSDPGTEPGKPTKAHAVLDQMGGISGLIYSSLPVVVFVPISTTLGLLPAIGAALGVAAVSPKNCDTGTNATTGSEE